MNNSNELSEKKAQRLQMKNNSPISTLRPQEEYEIDTLFFRYLYTARAVIT